jgi:hypothetical protein
MNADVSTIGYNTDRGPMRIAEYGRTVQRMVEHIRTLEDREDRNRAARAMVKVMAQLNPTLVKSEDLNHKLWDHLFIIADFDLDVDSPYPAPRREQFLEKPERIPYPDSEVKERHYGRIIKNMIDQLAAEKDPQVQQRSAIAAANAMKAAYLKWNRNTVDDFTIIADLKRLTKGVVALSPDTVLGKPQDLVDNAMQVVAKQGNRGKRSKRSGKKRRNPRG